LAAARRRLRAFGTGMSTMGKSMMMMGGAMVAPIALAVTKFVGLGDQLDKMSQRTGMSVEALSQLKFAAEQSGSSVEGLEAGIKGMQKMILNAERGLSTATDTLDDLGISMDDLAGKSPEDQFTFLAEALSRVEDPSRRAGLAMQAFGRSGQMLLPMLNGGAESINALRAEADRLGFTLTGAQATAAAEMADAWNRIKNLLLSVSIQIGTALAPHLISLAKWMTRVIAAARDWIAANKGLVVTITAVAVGVTSAGIAIFILGQMALVTSALLGVFTFAMTAAGIVTGAILSPIGLVVTAVVGLGVILAGLGVAFFLSTNAGKEAMAGLSSAFTDMKARALETFGAVTTALMSGDIAAAMHVMWTAVNVEWEKGLFAWKAGWNSIWKDIHERAASVSWINPLAAGIRELAGALQIDASTQGIVDAQKEHRAALGKIKDDAMFREEQALFDKHIAAVEDNTAALLEPQSLFEMGDVEDVGELVTMGGPGEAGKPQMKSSTWGSFNPWAIDRKAAGMGQDNQRLKIMQATLKAAKATAKTNAGILKQMKAGGLTFA